MYSTHWVVNLHSTESYDDSGPVGTDPRSERFQAFHDYLLQSFPLVHGHAILELVKVNTCGLIFVWKGSNSTLQPLLLAAHQGASYSAPSYANVVPGDPTTIDQWTHPPFSGYFDGGSLDNKSGLIGVMSAVETMLENSYHPHRTIVLAFGFNEEIGGVQGAQTLAVTLEEMFGGNGYAMLVDEGSSYEEQFVCLLLLQEPRKTIWMSALRSQHRVDTLACHLPTRNVHCLAAHIPKLPEQLRKDILDSIFSDEALRAAEEQLFMDPTFRHISNTTQAIDMIHGGVKTNALPEQAWAIINHRILAGSTDASATPTRGNLTVSQAFGFKGSEPPPITPTEDALPYQILSGTIDATYNSHKGNKGNDTIIIRPVVLAGMTDTKSYSSLTPHIFRYRHNEKPKGVEYSTLTHSVNVTM
ncbi:hypothetical protein J3A83DRAFT_4193380 [Scleroderma citrinum]